MNMLGQIGVVSLLGLRSLGQRLWQSLVIVVGVGCVTGLLLAMLSLVEGSQQAYFNSGDPRAAIVLAKGTIWESISSIPRDKARIVMDAPGIARDGDGRPIADAALVSNIPAVLRKNGGRMAITLRSFGDKGAMLRPGFHLVGGRMFRPGTHELIAGVKAQSRFLGMGLGDKVILPDGEWPIVGVFATGDLLDGELVGDTETLMPALGHKAYTSVVARMASPAAFAAFRAALSRNPALSVDVMRLPDWNRKIIADTSGFFKVIIYGVGVILGFGALFGCFNTMYAAIESRAGEIATLRALGYGGFAVASSVIVEAACLSVAGALIGAGAAWSLYDGVESGMGPDVFALGVSPALVGIAVLWAIAIAVLGGILPSVQAARWTVAEALRAR